MKRFLISLFLFILVFTGCSSSQPPSLGDGYQNQLGEIGYAITLSFDIDNSSFIKYIDGREVDRRTLEKAQDNTYELKSDKQDFEIILGEGNSFKLTIPKINDGKYLIMKNVGDVPVEFSNEFTDTDNDKALLE